jgi:hypothetical protein
MACVLSTRIASAIQHALNIDNEQVFFWTDSMTCLYWIFTPAKAFKAYVANRTGEIQAQTKYSQWRHCPTNYNPADIPTRKISIQDLKDSSL